MRREQYVGPWLPEPLLHDLDGTPLGAPAQNPADLAELGESVRMAFLVVLDRLSRAKVRGSVLMRGTVVVLWSGGVGVESPRPDDVTPRHPA